ncbi:MAG: Ig-like domain-containing protein, partial [bacterium]
MKRIFMIMFLFVLINNINSQTLTGARIVIDPGHGGHDASDDRFIAATGFWESDGNWAKANYLKPLLEGFGASVKLTRSGNTDADDLGLSTRSQIANDYNADYFHSIHSNGWDGKSNYTLMLFRGYDTQPVFAGSKTMGEYMMNNLYADNRTTGKYNRGDWSFYPDWGVQGLGVLRGLAMPGTLSEGSFHDYIPESWRLLNDAYKKHEAISFTRSFLQYFNDFPSTSGCIAGIVRDPSSTVSYYAIASLGDSKKPINNIKITVQPGNLIYNGDDKNNGYFLIENLAPGQYKVYYEAENFAMDSSTVTVVANKTIFADKNLIMQANPNAPQVVSSIPANLTQSVRLKAPIILNFDIKMNTASVQSAFVIQPAIAGTYTWANDDKQMTFTPSTYYLAGTEIKVTLKNTAKTIFNVFLAQNYVFTFNTRTKLNLLVAYPQDNQKNISTTVNVRAIFDAPIKQSTLPGNISFTKSDGSTVPIYVDLNGYANGKITFDPQTPLIPNESYKLTIKAGIGDTEGLFLGQNYEFNFTVDSEIYQSGAVIDPFDVIGGWWDPNNSGSTVGTNSDATTFSIVTDKKVNGSTAGKISYTFTDVNGVCRAHNSTKPNIGSVVSSKFGMWIYGDLSYNNLEYWFYYNSSTNAIVQVD